MPSTSVAAKVIASSTNQPIRAESATDCQTPLAADISASVVSSATWAEASYPVTVYIVSRKPTGSTYTQKNMPDVAPSLKPELLIVSVKTKSALWCRSGAKIRMAMITITPNTCQKTEMLLKSATRWDE